ncbi:MAG TPA: oligosaccharide flippase family protein [Luteibaculaceae bacterium]|nr:oligosaccharide flippase family protein [Luteibaculaceae bacterium]
MAKSVVKGFSVYFLGALFLKGINFLLIPVYVKFLSRAEYGYLEIANTIIVLMCILFSLGLPSIFQREFFKLDNRGRERLMNQLISAYLVVVVPAAAMAFAVLWWYSGILFEGVAPFICAAVITISSFLTFFQTVFRNTLELGKRPWLYLFNSVGVGALAVLVNLTLVIVLKIGFIGALCGTLVGLVVTLLQAILVWYKRGFTFQFISNGILLWVKEGAVFLGIPLAYWVITSTDRYFILHFLGADQLGVYGLATKFSAVFDPLLVAPALSVYTPIAYKKFAEGNFKQHLGWLTLGVIAAFFASSLPISWIARAVTPADYHDAIYLIPIQILGYAFYLVTMFSNCLLIFKKRNRETLIILVLVAICNVLLNSLLVRPYGLFGATCAFAGSQLIWMILSIWRNRVATKQSN